MPETDRVRVGTLVKDVFYSDTYVRCVRCWGPVYWSDSETKQWPIYLDQIQHKDLVQGCFDCRELLTGEGNLGYFRDDGEWVAGKDEIIPGGWIEGPDNGEPDEEEDEIA